MVIILMMSAKMATPDLLEIKVFWKKAMTSYFLSMTSPSNFEIYLSDFILKSLVTSDNVMKARKP